jgi:hypothetical protein
MMLTMAGQTNLNINSPGRELGRREQPDRLKTAEPFKSLFPVRPDDLNRLIESMQHDGFKSSFPIIVWREKAVVIDGHSRLEAARRVGLDEVIVQELSFDSEAAALRFAKEAQLNRRNLSDAELLALLPYYDKPNTPGTKFKEAAAGGKSAARTAEVLGVNRGKIEKARTVLEKATPKQLEAIAKGEKSLNKVYNETRAAAGQSRETAAEPSGRSGGSFISKNLYREENSRTGETLISLRTPDGLIPVITINSGLFSERNDYEQLLENTSRFLRTVSCANRLNTCKEPDDA